MHYLTINKGINEENLNWMCCETLKIEDKTGTFHGMIPMGEMSVQKDLQFVRKGKDWELVGAVDLGPLGNDLDEISKKSTKVQMASHYFQYIYVGLNGFRWPVAYYGTNNVNIHSIYLTFWSLIDELHGYGFNVHTVLMDGSNNNNKQFGRLLVKPQNAWALKYRASDPYEDSHHLSIIQDIKHVLKKICNSIFSSRKNGKSVHQLKFNAQFIFWDHFTEAYEFNCSSDLRLYHKLSRNMLT